jgi:hypothetical protein
MDKLPTEILHNIFIQLDLQHRLTYLTVCRRWWNVLDNGALFYNVSIIGDNYFNILMDVFEQSPARATQVEEIYLLYLTPYELIKRNILGTFPNVRMITSERYSPVTDPAFPYIKKHNGVVYSKPKLEYLYDIGDCLLVSQMLSSNLGSRLETLNLDFREYESSQYIIPRLKDLPVLKGLYIGRTSLTVLDLEHIHSAIPSIQNFALIRVSILAFSMPSDIVPATFITNLNFKDLHYADKETCAKMYQYMTRKYTSLSHIK